MQIKRDLRSFFLIFPQYFLSKLPIKLTKCADLVREGTGTSHPKLVDGSHEEHKCCVRLEASDRHVLLYVQAACTLPRLDIQEQESE